MDSTTITTSSEKGTSLSSLMTSPSPSLPSLPPLSPLFSPSPIPEQQQEEKANPHKSKTHRLSLTDNGSYHHQPTPLHPSSTSTTPHQNKKKIKTPNRTPQFNIVDSVSCSKCRPSSRDSKKPSIVPISPSSATSAPRRITPPSPLSLLNSLFHRRNNSSLSTNQTPQSTVGSSTDESDPHHWRLTATELSKKLVAATRKRDEAIVETSKLKYSLSELELKLAKLECSYHNLTTPPNGNRPNGSGLSDPFIQTVLDSRAASRALARALSSHLRKNPIHGNGNSGLLPAHMESFLNRVFFAGFELDSEEEIQVADPAEKCKLNKLAYESINRLTWEEVLTKGTKHFSEGLSRFCDSKMSDVVGSIGWTKAWPEPLLQAFFQAAKLAWLVRLLARSVHPVIPIIRVDRGAKFDGRFMDDVAADRAGSDRLEPVSVKMLVAPGFDVYMSGNKVVKCKVLCLYNSRCRDGYRDAGVADLRRDK